jgi:hypothetical protein
MVGHEGDRKMETYHFALPREQDEVAANIVSRHIRLQ